MKTYQGLTIEEARRLWAYDPDTGVLTWKVNRGAHKVAGKVAGSKSTRPDGRPFMLVSCRGKALTQSIVIWGVHTGAWPEDGERVFFKDKDPLNLKWENLVCDQVSVVWGSDVARRNNTSGVRGVCLDKRNKKWKAQIMADGKNYHLGLFATIEEAAAARKAAAKEYFGDFCNEAHEDIDCGAVAKWLESRVPSNNTSGVRGVSWDKRRCKWEAQIYVGGKRYKIGRFKTIEEAAAARKAAEEKKDSGGFCSVVQS